MMDPILRENLGLTRLWRELEPLWVLRSHS